MEDYAPSAFIGSWVLVVPYLCYRFCIFDRPILEECFLRLKKAHSCFSHVYMQRDMTSLVQLGRCTFFF